MGRALSSTGFSNNYSVLLFAERGIDRKELEEVARWFERCPGPVSVCIKHSAVQLQTNEEGVLLWGDLFQQLKNLRSQGVADASAFIYLLTKSPNEGNWFAVEDPDQVRNGFGHFADFDWVTTAPRSVIAAHYILKAIFNALLDEAGIHWEKMWHQEPRGCFFDFCAVKTQLALKLKAADVCGDCMAGFQAANIPDDLLKQTVDIMEASRRLALGTSHFLPPDTNYNHWPFPVAVTRHKAIQASSPLARFFLLLDHFDSIIRYFFLTHEIEAGRIPVIPDQPSLGWWLDSLARSMQGETLYRDVVRIAAKKEVVSLRNETRGHGYLAADDDSYKELAQRLEGVLSEIEEILLPFFQAHRLVIPKQIQLYGSNYRVAGDNLIGSHILHPHFQVDLICDPRSAGIVSERDVYLSDNRFLSFKQMSPFIRSATCPQCRHERLLITDGAQRYIDVFVGHRVQLGPVKSAQT